METGVEIRRAVDSGKVLIGYRECEKNVLKGIGRLLVVSKQFEKKKIEKLKHIADIAGIPFMYFEGSPAELGAICGKPHTVSTILILDEGKSKIIEIGKRGEKGKKK
ncbi:MAG: 50S ribosomal protein L30e [Candidatus Diapherotrites archaeon]|nr:50S ribosomal protein L30e [Candidatus Diapherotrites archaeon]